MPRPRKVNDPDESVRVWLDTLARGDRTVLAMPAGVDRLRRIMGWVDRQVTGTFGTGERTGSLRDELFDSLMARIDVFQANRAAFKHLFEVVKQTPCAGAALVPGAERRMVQAIESASKKPAGLLEHLLAAVLLAIYLATLRVWEQDESVDLARTMAALDQHLARVEKLIKIVKKS